MKQWPKDGKPLTNFEQLTEPVIKAIRFAFKLNRKNEDLDIPWSGYDIGRKEQATSLTPDKKLSVENLKYQEENQGRGALETIIELAVQLGIEQGRRLQKEASFGDELLLRAIKALVKMGDIESAQKLIEKAEDRT